MLPGRGGRPLGSRTTSRGGSALPGRPSTTTCGRLAGITLALLAVSPALAADGVVEINQARALAGGVTPGDTPGFPVTLSQPGSYRLTGNLATGSKGVTAILIAADDVTLDLNGFTIACTFFTRVIPLACAQEGGSGNGVSVDPDRSPRPKRTTVENGIVRGMGSIGVRLGDESTVREVKLFSNGGNGMLVGSRSHVDRCKAIENGGLGIAAGACSSVTNSIVGGNGNGISAGRSSFVARNIADSNGDAGIVAGVGGLVRENEVVNNRHRGIDVNSGSVIGNRAELNGGFGLRLGPETAYSQNSMANDNDPANPNDEVSGGVQMGPNVCHGAPCP